MSRFASLLRAVVLFTLSLYLSTASASPAPIVEARANGAIENLERRAVTPNAQGYYYSRYYKWWTDGGLTSATYINYLQNLFIIQWGTGGNLLGGQGWETGSPTRHVHKQHVSSPDPPLTSLTFSKIQTSGTFWPTGDALLSIYGWTRNPVTEYFIVQNYGTVNPTTQPGFVSHGTYTIDGAVYDVGVVSHTGAPTHLNAPGTTSYQTLWSVRRDNITYDVVDVAKHVAGWSAKGLTLGSTWDYQLAAVHAFNSEGTAAIVSIEV